MKINSKRSILAKLIACTKGIIKIEDAQECLSLNRESARLLLWKLSKSGWLKSIKSGTYSIVPLSTEDPSLTSENPLLVASTLYDPCYMGGWTAAHYWNFTDQLFLKTWVMTSLPVHHKFIKLQDYEFIFTQIKKDYRYGLKTEWIENKKVFLSDPHKTVIDFSNFINDYGATAFKDVFKSYLESEYKNLEKIFEYAQLSGNRTVFKRLGFMLELLKPQEQFFLKLFQENISKGYSKLDSSGLCQRIIGRWNLIVPPQMMETND